MMLPVSQAVALEGGQCGSVAQISSALKAEGQYEVITGKAATFGAPQNIFTTNQDQSLGYNVEAGANHDAGRMCVSMKYTNIHFNSNPGFSRPEWRIFSPGTPANNFLTQQENKDNEKVLMGAVTVIRQNDGLERQGGALFVTRGNPAPNTQDENAGTATVASSKSVATLVVMFNIKTNANFDTFVRRGLALSSRSGKKLSKAGER